MNRKLGWPAGFVLLLCCLSLPLSCAEHDRGAASDLVGLSPKAAWQRLGPERFGGSGAVKALGEHYIARYFEVFPSRATAAGFDSYDGELEDFSEESLERWFSFAQTVVDKLPAAVKEDCAAADKLACTSAQIDGELLARSIGLHLLDWQERAAPRHDPTLWTGVASGSTVYLLVRKDRPASLRMERVVQRLTRLPGFLQQGRRRLASGALDQIAPLHCRLAAARAASLADFYRNRLAEAGGSKEELSKALEQSLVVAGERAADALDRFAAFLAELEARVEGSPILGAELYRRRFVLYTGLDTPIEQVLESAEQALERQLAEADQLALKLWPTLFDGEAPAEPKQRVRRLFLRLGDDRAASVDQFVEDYRSLVLEAEAFVKEHQVVSVPDPLTLITDRSPAYFQGASVGGVYAAGPYRPDGATLLFLPTPPASFDAQQTEEFFRDFNHHFNTMITPHELMPGHYLQLKWAARHPSKIRALFGDPVTIEGWGTFAERLMLDLGWGDDLALAAHLKKRMENTARTIVDIRVHTSGMEQDEVERFVIDEALQEQQFARNMRRRTLTTSPQLVTYFLGSLEIEKAFAAFRRRQGDAADVREFTDWVMAIGPVPLKWWESLR